MGASFSLQKGTAMSSKIGVTGSTTPCCGGATEPLSKPPLYQFTTYANLFDFGNYNNQGAWSNEQKRSMLHFSNGDFEHVGNKYYGELTITFEYQIVPATRAPSGWAINPVDHGPSSPDPPSGWKPDAKIEITCYWKCGEDGVICKQKPDNAISEDGRDRKGEDGLPRN